MSNKKQSNPPPPPEGRRRAAPPPPPPPPPAARNNESLKKSATHQDQHGNLWVKLDAGALTFIARHRLLNGVYFEWAVWDNSVNTWAPSPCGPSSEVREIGSGDGLQLVPKDEY